MMAKKLLVSFLALLSVFYLIATVSATPLATGDAFSRVEVDGLNVGSNPAIVVGDSISVRVEFNSLVTAQDVTVEVQFEGNKKDVKAETKPFDVEAGQEYTRTLKLDVPFDLRDVISDSATLTVTVSGQGYKTETDYPLRVQRTPYSANIMSVNVPQTVKAGETFPVDVVLKNIGYNNLNDVFVTAKISALGIERTAFFGDIVSLECDKDTTSLVNYGINVTRKCNEDNQDTVQGRLFLQTPYGVKSGTYALDIQIENEDTVSSQTVQLVINNAFSSGTFIASGNQLLIVNPTNEVVVYRLIPESTSTVSASVSESLVAVPAGSSKTVTVDATSAVSGTQTYAVNIFSADGNLVNTISFSLTGGQGSNVTSPIVVLTVILAIIFIVLLVVLVVLIGKKPEKEEFGESYY